MDLADRQALDELKSAVGELAATVQRTRGRAVDEPTVQRISRDVLHQLHGAGGRRGYLPDPEQGSDLSLGLGVVPTLEPGMPDLGKLQSRGRDAVYERHLASPGKVARAIGRPVDQVQALQETTDTMILAAAYLGKEPQELAYFQDAYVPRLQAMDTATVAEGTEYVPRELSGTLIERVNLRLLVAALFPQLNMPTNPFDIPGFAVSRQRTGSHAEQLADTGQTAFKLLTLGSRKITLTAKKFAARAIVSKELEEDALLLMLPFMQDELVDFLAADIEDTIINGDTTGTHQDSDVVDADDPRKNWSGLRKLCQAGAKTDLANAAPTVTNSIRANRGKMGKYAVRPGELAHIVSIRGFMKLLGDTNLLTLEKYGPKATILAGELGKVDGSPVIVSEYVRDDLNATGVYDGTTTNRTIVLTVNTRGYLLGERRGVTVEVLRELYAEFDQDAVITSVRKAFAGRFPSTENTVAVAHNAATT